MAIWKSIAGSLESMAFGISLWVASLGAAALILVVIWPKWMACRYREFWAKLAVGFFRFMAAIAGIASQSRGSPSEQPLTQQPWVSTTLIALTGYLLWEFTGAIGDHRSKSAKEKMSEEHDKQISALKQDKEDAVQLFVRQGKLMSSLQSLVNGKFQRIRTLLAGSGSSRGSLSEVREALSPQAQIRNILEAIPLLFSQGVLSAVGNRQNFRVGLYVEQEGMLAPIDAFDLSSRRHDPFSSHSQHSERFRLDNVSNPSHAVRCVRAGKTMIVADCAADESFQYFNDSQRNYLKSMVAYPLRNFCLDGNKNVKAALLIDTNVADFFLEKDREVIEMTIEEFAARLGLEYAIKGLVRQS